MSLALLLSALGGELFSIVTSFWEDVTRDEFNSLLITTTFGEDVGWLGWFTITSPSLFWGFFFDVHPSPQHSPPSHSPQVVK